MNAIVRPSWAPLTPAQWGRAITPEVGDYEVAHLGGRYIIRLHDRSLIDESAVTSYIISKHTTQKEHTPMYDNEIIADDGIGIAEYLSHDAQVGWLDRYDMAAGKASYILKVGSQCKNMKEARDVTAHWSRILYDGKIGYVTLDTDPSEPGRPRKMRPNTPAILLVEFPKWHPDAGTLAALYYTPVTTWPTDPDPITGLREELANYNKGSGVRYLIEYLDLPSIEAIDQWLELGNNAVRAAAVARKYNDATPDELAEIKAEEAHARLVKLSRM